MMQLTAIIQDNGLFIPNVDINFWRKNADKNGIVKLDITPKSATTETQASLREKKLSMAGALKQYANPALIPLEDKAVEMAILEKYGMGQSHVD